MNERLARKNAIVEQHTFAPVLTPCELGGAGLESVDLVLLRLPQARTFQVEPLARCAAGLSGARHVLYERCPRRLGARWKLHRLSLASSGRLVPL